MGQIKNMAGGFFENIELLTNSGWVSADRLVEGDSVVVWEPDSCEIHAGKLVSKTVEDLEATPVVSLRGAYIKQSMVDGQRVWGSKLLYSEVGHEPRWVRVQQGVQNENEYDRVCVSGFHYGSGCGLSVEEVAVVGLLYCGAAVSGDNSIVVNVVLEDTDRSYKIQKTLGRLAEKFPDSVDVAQTSESAVFHISGTCFRRIKNVYQVILFGEKEAYELLWSMSLVEKNVFVWFAVHGQKNKEQRYGWCTVTENEHCAVWLQTLAALSGMKSSCYRTSKGFVVSIQQEAEVKSFIEKKFIDAGRLFQISVNSDGFLARQEGTIFVAANS